MVAGKRKNYFNDASTIYNIMYYIPQGGLLSFTSVGDADRDPRNALTARGGPDPRAAAVKPPRNGRPKSCAGGFPRRHGKRKNMSCGSLLHTVYIYILVSEAVYFETIWDD